MTARGRVGLLAGHPVQVGAAMSAVCAAAGGATAWSARPGLPEALPCHWDLTGRPDQFTSPRAFLVAQLVLPLATAMGVLLLGRTQDARRAMSVLAGGQAGFLSTVMALITLTQRGATTSHAAPIAQWVVLPALAAGAAVALVTWLIVRAPAQPAGVDTSQVSVAVLRADPRALVAWSGTTRRAEGRIALVVVFGVLPMVVILAVTAANGQWGLAVVMAAPFAALTAATSLTDCAVMIGRRGVHARAFGLIPLVNVPLSDIGSAEAVTDVAQLGPAGIPGIRIGPWSTPRLVTSDGEALTIHRRDLPDVVITIDDATRAAATVNTLVARRAGVL